MVAKRNMTPGLLLDVSNFLLSRNFKNVQGKYPFSCTPWEKLKLFSYDGVLRHYAKRALTPR